MKAGWLRRELDSAALKVSQWPQWMKDAVDIKMLDEADIKIIKDLIEESKKPPVAICGKSVLQDSQCSLPWTHIGLCRDRDGIWRCPWCKNDAFQNHLEDCPAKGFIE